MSTNASTRPVDLVLGGGGVRGVAHVGALAALEEHGYAVQRVAGASSGALAGAMIAAGARPDEMRAALADLDWRAFTTADVLSRLADRPLVGAVVNRLTEGRSFDPTRWIATHLEERGVRTWADLRLQDPEPWVPQNQRYRLVVRCLDIVHRRVVRLPWDYARYGLEPDEQPVATAVRASMAVPLVFDPVPIGNRDDGGGLLIDGGLGSGFSVGALDRLDGRPPQHPTFALQLFQRGPAAEWPSSEFAQVRAIMQTMIDTGNQMVPVGPCDEARSIGLDTSGIRTLDVRITPEQQDELFSIGYDAVQRFLERWDLDLYRQQCRGS